MRICHPNAESNRDWIQTRYSGNPKQGKSASTPLLFSTTGGMAMEFQRYHCRLAEIVATKGPFLFLGEGGRAGGIRKAPFKKLHDPPPLSCQFFSHGPLEAVVFSDDSPPQKKKYIYITIIITISQDFTFFDILR